MGLILCERCSRIVAEEEREERALAEVIPPHLHLYDFGDGVTSMPIPDFGGSGSYLTTSICLLEDEKHRALGIELRYKQIPAGQRRRSSIIDTTNILEALKKAVPLFDSQAFECAEGGNINPKAMQERVKV